MRQKENKGVYFLKLEIENFRSFKGRVTLDLSDGKNNWRKWTVILGDNGTGKTSLLLCLSWLEIIPFDDGTNGIRYIHSIYKELFPIIKGGTNIITKIDCEIINSNNSEIIATGFSKLQGGTGYNLVPDSYKDLLCYGYGANRFMSSNALTDSKFDNSETLLNDDAKLINAEEWLLGLDYSASKESDMQSFATKRRDQVEDILKNILPDIKEIRFTTPTKEKLKPTVEFKTPYGWITIHQLSLGYKTMVAWMVDLAARMFERYPDSDNPLAEPAIVLVDEIDLHMHPKWQRKIFKYLDERFPRTQFIVTAHSPLIVQSAPADANIVLLRREGDHVIIDQDIKSVRSWRLDQILSSDLFGIGSRSPEIENLMEERRKLIQKNKLTLKEKKRLNELNSIEYNLPTAESKTDLEAMEVIRKAADYIKTKQ